MPICFIFILLTSLINEKANDSLKLSIWLFYSYMLFI
nr:MAG TPA: hypothetical protein [Caudoviricetes sp.]